MKDEKIEVLLTDEELTELLKDLPYVLRELNTDNDRSKGE